MRTLKLIILSLTLFLSQGGYSLSIVCPEPALMALQELPLIPFDSINDLTEDEFDKILQQHAETDIIFKHNAMVLDSMKPKETGEYDSEGSKHGFWTYRGGCGGSESGTYVHGKRQGEWYSSGPINHVWSTYKDDKLHGLWKSGGFYGKESGNYKNGKKDGVWIKTDNMHTLLVAAKGYRVKHGDDIKYETYHNKLFKPWEVQFLGFYKDGVCISGNC